MLNFQHFKSMMMPMQGHSKQLLYKLYTTDSIFEYLNLKFYFGGTSYRTSEKLLLYICFPAELLGGGDYSLIRETYALRLISPMIAELGESYRNIDKNVREKAQFSAQSAGEYIIRRNGIRYDQKENEYVLRLNFNVPLVNALSVNAKAAIRAVHDILTHIHNIIQSIDLNELKLYVETYKRQQEIRCFIRENDLCAFVANGSILPRENGTSEPMKNAIPFKSPKELEVTVPLSDGSKMIGMGIKRGVTVITGGGYSGKSTLLDAIEMGIYDHIPGDGREYVLTDPSALKIYAEDGRPVSELDLSPFFRYLPGGTELKCFSTPHASGSVSQAANIIEAVCAESKLLLIDEDKSATNFMIRDKNMRRIVKNEPIIPFTDRIRELYEQIGVSTILVIGGSSEYLSYADTVILMDDYLPRVLTEEIESLELGEQGNESCFAVWTHKRRIIPKKTSQPFLYVKNVVTENEKKIILDEHSADITLLTALFSGDQLNTLACVMEHLLTDKEADSSELIERVGECVSKLFLETETVSLVPEAAQRFYEDIRPIDAFCCVNRMRGLHFKTVEGDA